MDARYVKKEKLIMDTFKSMLAVMPFEEITVQELTKRAKIDRKTFYLHYPSINDLLLAIQIEISSEYIERIKGLDPINDLYETVKHFFEFSEEKGRFYEIITSSTEYSYTYIRNQMIKRVVASAYPVLNPVDKEKEWQIAFINNNLLFFYRDWINKGKQETVSEIIELTYKMIKHGLDINKD